MLKERTADLTAAGLWEQVDDKTGSTQCWFEITERDGIYEGTIVRTFAPTNRTNINHKREQPERKGARFLGLTIISGMRRNGYSYENGTITDPRDGSRYRALMRLSSDATSWKCKAISASRCSGAARSGIGSRRCADGAAGG
jgi:hypothetical protein